MKNKEIKLSYISKYSNTEEELLYLLKILNVLKHLR